MIHYPLPYVALFYIGRVLFNYFGVHKQGTEKPLPVPCKIWMKIFLLLREWHHHISMKEEREVERWLRRMYS